MTGKLIVLEGIDGSGTTTQAARLGAHFSAYVTREPSHGPIGMLIRQLLAIEVQHVDQTAMALLFAADRMDHLRREIEPKLAAGINVISDRYVISSCVYQARFIAPEFVWHVNASARAADLTLLLAVPPEVAATRRATRGGPTEMYDDLQLQTAFANQYASLEADIVQREHVVSIDGTRSQDQVFASLVEAVKTCIDPTRGSSST